MVQSHLQLPSTETAEVSYGQLFATLLRRRFCFLGVLGGSIATAVLLAFVLPPTYESTMQLLLEANYQGRKVTPGLPITSDQQFADPNIEVDYATQLGVMRSQKLLQQVVNRLQEAYPDLEVEDLRKSLEITQVMEETGPNKEGTKIIKIVSTDSDPIKTQRVLTTLQEVYQTYNLQQQRQRLARGLSFINKQLPLVRQRLARSEAALEQFRQRFNLVNPEQQSTAIAQALDKIQQERRSGQAQFNDARARYLFLQQQLAQSPRDALLASRLSQSARYQTILNELQKNELALTQKRLQFTESSPVVEQLLEQQQKLLGMLPQEIRRVLGPQARSVKPGTDLVAQGQLSQVDLKLVDEMLEASSNVYALSARDQSLARAEQQLRSELNRFPTLLTAYNRLQPEVELHRETLQQLLRAQQDLSMEIARGGFAWQIVEAPLEGEKVAPSLLKNLLLGIVAGTFLGCITVFFREVADDAVHTSAELKTIDLPLLGMTPELPRMDPRDLAHTLPFRHIALSSAMIPILHWPPFREAMDLIYKNIQLLPSNLPLKSLAVTSALAGEGKTTLSLALAVSAARLHQRVLLIDADLRHPSLHHQLNLQNEEGLSTLLGDETAVLDQIDLHQVSLRPGCQVAGCELDVLTAGPTAADPAKLLSSQRMRELVKSFERHYDLVILDVPPVLGLVDTVLTASVCQGVVLVGRMGHVTRTELSQAIETLNQFNVIGIIANGMNQRPNSYSPYTDPQSSVSLLKPSALSTQVESALATRQKTERITNQPHKTAQPYAVESVIEQDLVMPQVLNEMSPEELQKAVKELLWKIQMMSGFIAPQEEELSLQHRVVEQLQAQLKQVSGYEHLLLEVQLQNEQERYASLREALEGQRQKLQEQQSLLKQYQSALERKQHALERNG